MKIIHSLLLLVIGLVSVQTHAQKLKITSPLIQNNHKITIYQEWPQRKLIDTLHLVDGSIQYNLPKNDNVVYSLQVRKPFISEVFFSSKNDINIHINKDTQVVINGSIDQKKFNVFEKSIKPLEKKWNEWGNKYTASTDLEEKLAFSENSNRVAEQVQQMRLDFAIKNKSNIAGAWIAHSYLFAWNEVAVNKLLPAFKNKEWANILYQSLQKKEAEFNHLSMVNAYAPNFKLMSFNGSIIDLDSIIKKNKYVLVDFWASWCTPCRKTNRELAPHYKMLQEKGIEIVSISVDEQDELWRNAIKSDHIPWVQLISPEGINSKVAQSYKVKSLPATYLINQSGKIILQHVKLTDLEQLK